MHVSFDQLGPFFPMMVKNPSVLKNFLVNSSSRQMLLHLACFQEQSLSKCLNFPCCCLKEDHQI